MIAVLNKNASMAIHDDYFNWAENDHHREVGKPLFID